MYIVYEISRCDVRKLKNTTGHLSYMRINNHSSQDDIAV